MQEAVREVLRAQLLDPLSPVVNANVGWTLALAGERERAMSELQRAVSLDPLNAMAYFYIGFLHGAAGRWAEAISAFQRSLEIAPAFPGIREAIVAARADMGDTAPAREWLDRTEASREPGYVMSSMVARVLFSVGRRDEALARLERALEERDPMLVWLPHMPAFGPLRGTTRFQRVLRGAHLS
jgi:tetratricopeptide (TPR) repeat protein